MLVHIHFFNCFLVVRVDSHVRQIADIVVRLGNLGHFEILHHRSRLLVAVLF